MRKENPEKCGMGPDEFQQQGLCVCNLVSVAFSGVVCLFQASIVLAWVIVRAGRRTLVDTARRSPKMYASQHARPTRRVLSCLTRRA